MKKRTGRAVIVGASSGIGYEVARLLIADGWTLALAARRTEPLEMLKQLAPSRVVTARIDVTDAQADVQLQQLIAQIGGMDLYFHASGVGSQNPQLQSDIELQTMRTNALGFTRMVGAAYRYFASQGDGHLAVISSIAGTRGLGLAPAYSATKALQNTYIESLAQLSHMRGLNIHFTDVRPGFVRTPLLGEDGNYPLLMQVVPVARAIVKALYAQKSVIVINRRWRILTALWSLVPHWLWRRLKVK